MTFKQMELINKFIDVCKALGVPDHEAFATVDLYEEQNMNQVIICISALMRKVRESYSLGIVHHPPPPPPLVYSIFDFCKS